ncbi:hypothetical protein BKA93DRAFT_749823 [Sparassis latifolia]
MSDETELWRSATFGKSLRKYVYKSSTVTGTSSLQFPGWSEARNKIFFLTTTASALDSGAAAGSFYLSASLSRARRWCQKRGGQISRSVRSCWRCHLVVAFSQGRMPAVNSLTGGAQRAVQCGSCNDVPCLGEFAFTRRSSRGTEEDAVQFAPYEWNVRPCAAQIRYGEPERCDGMPFCIIQDSSEQLPETGHAARRRTPPGMRQRRRRARRYDHTRSEAHTLDTDAREPVADSRRRSWRNWGGDWDAARYKKPWVWAAELQLLPGFAHQQRRSASPILPCAHGLAVLGACAPHTSMPEFVVHAAQMTRNVDVDPRSLRGGFGQRRCRAADVNLAALGVVQSACDVEDVVLVILALARVLRSWGIGTGALLRDAEERCRGGGGGGFCQWREHAVEVLHGGMCRRSREECDAHLRDAQRSFALAYAVHAARPPVAMPFTTQPQIAFSPGCGPRTARVVVSTREAAAVVLREASRSRRSPLRLVNAFGRSLRGSCWAAVLLSRRSARVGSAGKVQTGDEPPAPGISYSWGEGRTRVGGSAMSSKWRAESWFFYASGGPTRAALSAVVLLLAESTRCGSITAGRKRRASAGELLMSMGWENPASGETCPGFVQSHRGGRRARVGDGQCAEAGECGDTHRLRETAVRQPCTQSITGDVQAGRWMAVESAGMSSEAGGAHAKDAAGSQSAEAGDVAEESSRVRVTTSDLAGGMETGDAIEHSGSMRGKLGQGL